MFSGWIGLLQAEQTELKTTESRSWNRRSCLILTHTVFGPDGAVYKPVPKRRGARPLVRGEYHQCQSLWHPICILGDSLVSEAPLTSSQSRVQSCVQHSVVSSLTPCFNPDGARNQQVRWQQSAKGLSYK